MNFYKFSSFVLRTVFLVSCVYPQATSAISIPAGRYLEEHELPPLQWILISKANNTHSSQERITELKDQIENLKSIKNIATVFTVISQFNPTAAILSNALAALLSFLPVEPKQDEITALSIKLEIDLAFTRHAMNTLESESVGLRRDITLLLDPTKPIEEKSVAAYSALKDCMKMISKFANPADEFFKNKLIFAPYVVPVSALCATVVRVEAEVSLKRYTSKELLDDLDKIGQTLKQYQGKSGEERTKYIEEFDDTGLSTKVCHNSEVFRYRDGQSGCVFGGKKGGLQKRSMLGRMWYGFQKLVTGNTYPKVFIDKVSENLFCSWVLCPDTLKRVYKEDTVNFFTGAIQYVAETKRWIIGLRLRQEHGHVPFPVVRSISTTPRAADKQSMATGCRNGYCTISCYDGHEAWCQRNSGYVRCSAGESCAGQGCGNSCISGR